MALTHCACVTVGQGWLM